MEDTDITKARDISLKVLEKKRNNKVGKNRSDRVHWEEIKCNKPGRIRSGVIVNIVHDDIESFLDDAYFLLNSRMKNALKKYNDFKINTVLCTDFNSKSKDENFQIGEMHIDGTTDIELWYNNNAKRAIVTKLKQLQVNNCRMQLDVICLAVCFSESESVPSNNYITNNYASTSACSSIRHIVTKIPSPAAANQLLVEDNNIVQPQINNAKPGNVQNYTSGVTDSVKFYHQNMQSINNKVDKLASLAKAEKFDFLLLSEHWITESKDIPNIDGYYWASAYRRRNRFRGGAAILVSEHRRDKITQRNDINDMSKEMVIELAACAWNERNLIILALYRPPNGSIAEFLKFFGQVLETITRKGNFDIIIGGDFNIDFLQKEGSATKRLMKMLSSYKLLVTINEYTRERLRSKTCIDNIITNLQNVQSRVVKADISDHHGQEIIVPHKKTNKVLRGKATITKNALSI